jgi:hypothetical protein
MAKKSKGFRELLNQPLTEKDIQKGLTKLHQKLQQGALGQQITDVVINPQGEIKMSDVLEAFAEPYLEFATNHNQREKLFSVAIIAWNAAIMPEQDRQLIIEKTLEQGLKGDAQSQQDARDIIDEMISRKQQLFADNQRYILDFQLQDSGKQFHLSVASTLLASQPVAE